MPFAARKHDDGTWRLCKRMGDTITYSQVGATRTEIQFSSQAKTKACADALNERWKEIEKMSRPNCTFSDEMVGWMLGVVANYEGTPE